MFSQLSLIGGLLLSGLVAGAAQTPLSLSQVKEDLVVFKTSLLEAHPGIGLYSSEAALLKSVEELEADLEAEPVEPMTLYRKLKEIITQIQDGHTDIALGKSNYPAQSLLPFKVKIIANRLFIIENLSNQQDLAIPTEIISINGQTTTAILKTLYALTSADGNNPGFKTAYNEVIFSRQFVELIDPAEFYELRIKNLEGEEENISVKGIADKLLYTGEDPMPLQFSIDEKNNYALLTVHTFQYRLIKKRGQDFHDFIKDSFRQLRKKGIENLVIDLRDNVGGESILAITLYAYLVEDSFKVVEKSMTKLSGPITHSQHSNYPNGDYRFLKTHRVKKVDDDLYELTDGLDSKASFDSDFIYKGPNGNLENIRKNKFTGTVYVLTNGLTFSAATTFSALCYANKEALLVGEETGGAYGDFCGGGFLTVTLPHSKLILQIPMMKREKALQALLPQGRGTVPHHVVTADLASLTNGEDPCINAVLKLIKK